jgi:hypothetical protein
MQWNSEDGVTLDVLAPSLPFLADIGDDINENSIVAMLHYREFSELFMGDAGESSEAYLLASGIDLRADAQTSSRSVTTDRVTPRHRRSSLPSTLASQSSRSDGTTRSVIQGRRRLKHGTKLVPTFYERIDAEPFRVGGYRPYRLDVFYHELVGNAGAGRTHPAPHRRDRR